MTLIRYMKKWLIIFISTMSFLFAEAQPTYRLDSVVSVRSDIQKKTSWQKHDTVQNRLFAQHENRIETILHEGSRHVTQYDQRGNELEHIYSNWDSTVHKWIEQEKVTKSYDSQDRMLSYIEYEKIGTDWIGLAKTEQIFEERAISNIEYTGRGGRWHPIFKNVEMLGDKDVSLLSYNYQWDSLANDWVFWMKHDKTFSSDTLLHESTYIWENGKWMNKERISYVYEKNKLSDRVVYSGTKDDWQFNHLIQFRPFDTGHAEEAFYWSVEEEKWKPESFQESYMDRHGRVTDYAAFIWNKKKREYVRAAQGITVYDAKDRITFLQEAQYDDEGKGINGSQMTLYFDKEDNLYREIHRSFHPKDSWRTHRTKEITFRKDITYQDEQGKTYVIDPARLGMENLSKSQYAIDYISIYKHTDGQKILEEEIRYYYTPLSEKY